MYSSKCKYTMKNSSIRSKKRKLTYLPVNTAPQGKWKSEDTNLSPLPSTPTGNKPAMNLAETVLQSIRRFQF